MEKTSATSTRTDSVNATRSTPGPATTPNPPLAPPTLDTTNITPSSQISNCRHSRSSAELNNDPKSHTTSGAAPPPSPTSPGPQVKPAYIRSDIEAAMNPNIRRRVTRAGTFRTVDDFDEFASQPGWHRMSLSLPQPTVWSLLTPSLAISGRRAWRGPNKAGRWPRFDADIECAMRYHGCRFFARSALDQEA